MVNRESGMEEVGVFAIAMERNDENRGGDYSGRGPRRRRPRIAGGVGGARAPPRHLHLRLTDWPRVELPQPDLSASGPTSWTLFRLAHSPGHRGRTTPEALTLHLRPRKECEAVLKGLAEVVVLMEGPLSGGGRGCGQAEGSGLAGEARRRHARPGPRARRECAGRGQWDRVSLPHAKRRRPRESGPTVLWPDAGRRRGGP